MAEPQNSREPAANRGNKASAMRWGIGLVALLALGAAAWLISNPRGAPIDPAPRHEPGYEQHSGGNQPPAVAPDAKSNTGTLDAPPPATSGEGTR